MSALLAAIVPFFAQKSTWLGVVTICGSIFGFPAESSDLLTQGLTALGGALLAWGNGK